MKYFLRDNLAQQQRELWDVNGSELELASYITCECLSQAHRLPDAMRVLWRPQIPFGEYALCDKEKNKIGKGGNKGGA